MKSPRMTLTGSVVTPWHQMPRGVVGMQSCMKNHRESSTSMPALPPLPPSPAGTAGHTAAGRTAMAGLRTIGVPERRNAS
eukprot:6902581-Alexandrium_andersonii.AAC.1